MLLEVVVRLSCTFVSQTVTGCNMGNAKTICTIKGKQTRNQ